MSNITNLRDHRGQVFGRIMEQADQKVYLDARGSVVARYLKSADRTIDKRGSYVGQGDLGLVELGKTLD